VSCQWTQAVFRRGSSGAKRKRRRLHVFDEPQRVQHLGEAQEARHQVLDRCVVLVRERRRQQWDDRVDVARADLQ
jgi:hypothetical protein